MKTEVPNEYNNDLVERMYDNQLVIKSILLKEIGKVKIQVAQSGDKKLKENYEELLKLLETIVQQYRLTSEDSAEIGVDLPAMEKQANELEQKITSVSNISLKKKEEAKSWKDIQQKLKKDECFVEMARTEFYTKGRWTDSIYYSAMVIDKTCKSPKFVFINKWKQFRSKYC